VIISVVHVIKMSTISTLYYQLFLKTLCGHKPTNTTTCIRPCSWSQFKERFHLQVGQNEENIVWLDSSLSSVGRITLAQSSLTSIPGYIVQATCIHVSVSD